MDRFGRLGSAMTGWWSGPLTEDAVQLPASRVYRKPRTQQTYVEVIGGNSGSRPSEHRATARQAVVGPPRLPQELILLVIALAADDVNRCWQGRRKSIALLSLAATNRASYKLIATGTILPDLHLTGVRQVQAFANALRFNALDICNDAKKIRRLTIKRAATDVFAHSSLYRDVEETKQFERTTLAPLRIILSHCTNLRHLSLDTTARVLDPRTGYAGDKGSWQAVTLQLEELIILQSLYGGDLNERLWDISSVPGSLPSTGSEQRWNKLRCLQLHGPRFRMTAATAMALSQLPALSHLALIMPWIVASTTETDATSAEGRAASEHEQGLAAATDALGRKNVWQLLVDGLAARLQVLVLVCHDIDGYLGSVQRLGPSFRAVQWRCPEGEAAPLLNVDLHRRDELTAKLRARAPKLELVTANAVWNGDQRHEEPHPLCFSKWMLHRAEQQRQWSFASGETDVIEELSISTIVESWRAPVVLPSSPDVASEASVVASRGSEPARRRVGLDANGITTSSPWHAVNSIDDLD